MIFRFIPEGSYINANELGPEKVAYKIYKLLNDFEAYVDYFRWKNHYYFDEAAKTPDMFFCDLCTLLNKDQKKRTTFKNMRRWWDSPWEC